MNISEEIFELYSYIVEEDIEVHYYKNIRELDIYVSSFKVSKFLSTLSDKLEDFLEDCFDDGVNAKILSRGTLCIDIIEIIEYYCTENEVDYWINKFESLENKGGK